MSNTNDQTDKTPPTAPKIVRAQIDTLTIYEISDVELLLLEKGYPGSIILNFAIFLFSVAVSFTITLSTTTVHSERLFNSFLIVLLVGYILGILLAILWLRSFLSSTRVSKTIRQRLCTEGSSQRVEGIMGIETPPSEQLEILEANYGIPGAMIDIKSHLQRMIKDNTLRIVASNAIAGDPALTKRKKLTIKYKLSETIYYSEFLEGTEALIPLAT